MVSSSKPTAANTLLRMTTKPGTIDVLAVVRAGLRRQRNRGGGRHRHRLDRAVVASVLAAGGEPEEQRARIIHEQDVRARGGQEYLTLRRVAGQVDAEALPLIELRVVAAVDH